MKYLQKIKFSFFILIRRAVYLSLGASRFLPWHTEKGVAVFCYHSVSDDRWRYSIDFEDLKKQVNHLLKTRKPISKEELLLHVRGERVITEPSFLIAFDDGYHDILMVKEFFRERGIRPIAFVLAEPENANREELDTERPFLTKEEILELKEAGWDIGCHSATHADFSKLSASELGREITHAKTRLESKLGFSINHFAYPKGMYASLARELVKQAGYDMAFTMNEGFVPAFADPTVISRIGVDRTHSFGEFKTLTTPLTLTLRKFVKSKYFFPIAARMDALYTEKI